MKIPLNAIEKLKTKARGDVIIPRDPVYDEVRKVWNAMIDRRPEVIVRIAAAEDVPYAIAFARENGLEIKNECLAAPGASYCRGQECANENVEHRTSNVPY